MLAKILVCDQSQISYPEAVYRVPIQNDDFIKEFKTKKFDRFIVVYSNENKIFNTGIYAKPLKIQKIDNVDYLIFKGLKKVNCTASLLQYIETKSLDLLTEVESDQYKTFTKKGINLETIVRFDFIEEDNLKSIPKKDISSMVNILRDAFKNQEKIDDHITVINPSTDEPYTFEEIIQLQFEDSSSEEFNELDGSVILVDILISFIRDNLYGLDKMSYLECNSLKSKYRVWTEFLSNLTTALQIENDIVVEMNKNMYDHQKEYLLREKMKTIQQRLDKIDGKDKGGYEKEIEDPKLKFIYPKSVVKIIEAETKKLASIMPASPEANVSKTYIETLKQLPWRKVEKDFLDFNKVKETLDKYHYGLDEVKERIIEYIAVMVNNKKKNKAKNEAKLINIDDDYQIDLNLFKEDKKVKNQKETFNNVPILTLVGPPGTGKTSLSKAIAEALNKKFLKISLGGVHDEAEIRGHRRTYVGSMPGKIIKGMLKCEISNPLILLDEIDKMASDMKGDPASAMLEVLDPEQNAKFQDHYLEHEYDLSKVVFIATANSYEDIPGPLIDRVEVIELNPYTISEKVKIARSHLIPKVLEQVSLKEKMMKIDDETLKYVIRHYTLEAGVRGLKRILDKLARKIVVKHLNDPSLKEFEITLDNLESLLGVIKYKEETEDTHILPGVVNGLAYTSYGGSTLQIEVTTYPGKGEIKLTGQLKDVMQESAQIALTYVRANAEKFGINDFDFENNTIHIHVPEGAVPKDGPSAGVTFTTAIISSLTKKPVPSKYAMTGEITLRGKVLEIGGLKEKSFAATQKGVKVVFIPDDNVKNLKDIPDEIKQSLTYVPVKYYDDIFDVIFNKNKPKNEIKTKK
ncbi:endopeptidase La [Mycoplasmopsis ciconiae]|uniref:Lon protease n=1 Tax=Mycoplasmopsis ciconiae TaxID=561067 RepID=A0ABU7MLY1_9BACT|nr:endopeptidase La [Mycoplasmopsis ciconiae]